MFVENYKLIIMAKKGHKAPDGYVSLYKYGIDNGISAQVLHSRKKKGSLPLKRGYIKADYKFEWDKPGAPKKVG